MNISKLIEKLENIKKENGDLIVLSNSTDYDSTEPIFRVSMELAEECFCSTTSPIGYGLENEQKVVFIGTK